MPASERRLKIALAAASGLCILAAVGLFPPVAAKATWDGRIESLPGAILLWYAVSLLLLALGLAFGLASVIWLRRTEQKRQPYRRRILLRTFTVASGIAIAIALCFWALYVRRNRVDILERLAPPSGLYAEAKSIAERRGKTAAMDYIWRYFASRRSPKFVRPAQLWLNSETLIRQARGIVSGTFPGFPEFNWRPGRHVEWRCGAKSDRKPLLFELQGQRFIFYLLAELDGVPERESIELARAFASEWRRGNTWPNANRYAWNDDATSNRIQAHVYLMERARKLNMTSRKDELAFLESLLKHADRLMDAAAYNARTNHGMMQNCALLSIALAYPEFDRGQLWQRTAVKRMEEYLLHYAVTPEGVFLELAPGYHFYAMLKALWFYASCRQAKIDLDPRFETTLRKMLTFCVEILQPDRSLPMIADTRGGIPDVAGWPWGELPNWPELRRLRSALTSSGELPNEPCARLWPESGYFVLRAPATKWTPASAMMLTLKAGPRSHAHGHYDALSITLFANGRPLLTGPGYPPYDEKRCELIATTSQNTVSVDGRSQRAGAAEVVFCDARHVNGPSGPIPQFAAVKGRSLLYEGVRHDRTILYGPASQAVLIVDELRSNEQHEYRQHFRLAPGLRGRTLAGTLAASNQGRSSRAGDILRITALRPGRQSQRLPCTIAGQVAEFPITARSATVLALLDFSKGGKSSSLSVGPRSIEWRGDRGRLTVTLPIVSPRSCVFLAKSEDQDKP
ncbi:MAG: heparinase II/III family protein [Planctomycetota bacterium]|jgi:hypothetical protein